MPAGTLGFRLWGRIERADYADLLVPALTKAAENGAEMRTLFLVDELEQMFWINDIVQMTRGFMLEAQRCAVRLAPNR